MLMRLRIVIPLLLVGLFAVLLPVVARHKHPASDTGSVAPGEPCGSPAVTTKSQPDANIAGEAVADHSPAAEYDDYVNQRTVELEDLSMTVDAGSLITIESELDSRDPRIQAAAVSAAIQFGSRDVIPALQDASGHTDDPVQKLNIVKAIQFLELPTESEFVNATPPSGDGSAAN